MVYNTAKNIQIESNWAIRKRQVRINQHFIIEIFVKIIDVVEDTLFFEHYNMLNN